MPTAAFRPFLVRWLQGWAALPSAQRWSTPLGGCHDDWLFVDPAFGASVGAMMEVVAIKSPFQTVAGGVEGHWVQVDDVMLVVELNPH